MFTYLKTMNQHSCAVEPIWLPVEEDAVFVPGAVCQMNEGVLTSMELGKPKYITMEHKSAGDGKTTLKCFKVLPGMLFKADVYGDITGMYVGELVALAQDSNDNNVFVNLGEGEIEIINLDTYSTDGTITVSII